MQITKSVRYPIKFSNRLPKYMLFYPPSFCPFFLLTSLTKIAFSVQSEGIQTEPKLKRGQHSWNWLIRLF